jgi:fibronectin type 3 domain-containing protein
VTWSASSGATSYEVWRNTSDSSASATKIGSPTTTTYDDTSVSSGRLYYYWIKAKGSLGTSGFSSSNSGYRMLVPISLAPPAPTNVSASDGTYSDKVRVTWSASSGATSYEIWRSTSNSSASATKIGSPTTNSYDDTSALSGRTYYYWVKARNQWGTSGFSSSNSGYRRLSLFVISQ